MRTPTELKELKVAFGTLGDSPKARYDALVNGDEVNQKQARAVRFGLNYLSGVQDINPQRHTPEQSRPYGYDYTLKIDHIDGQNTFAMENAIALLGVEACVAEVPGGYPSSDFLHTLVSIKDETALSAMQDAMRIFVTEIAQARGEISRGGTGASLQA